MVNPHNAAGAAGLPPDAAENMRALTEFDVELHRYAAARQARATPPVLATAQAAARSNALPLADLVRVYTPEPEIVALGRALLIHGNEVLLHPPAGAAGASVVTMRDIPLDLHGRLAGTLVVAHAASAPLRFDVQLVREADALLDTSFLVCAGQPLAFELSFAPVTGPGQLKLATRMASPEADNGFAWATFVNVTIA
jgi:hypothetical protein